MTFDLKYHFYLENNMKRLTLLAIILSLGMVFLLPALAPAQQMPGGRGGGEAMLKRLQDSLSLTTDQVIKLKAIMTKSQEEMTKLRSDLGDDREAMMLGMRELREKQNAKIDSVLTTEQRIKFKKMNDEQRAQMRNRPGGPPGMRGN
jgi:Spy/CpxP family protein refolding chaperone